MSDIANNNHVARQAVARLLAKYFLLHLEAELEKPDRVLQRFHLTLPVRQMTQEWIVQVRSEFKIGLNETMPVENIFRKWCEISVEERYEDLTFVDYNHGFLYRLLDLRDGTPETQELLLSTMRSTFDGFDYEKAGYTVAFFLESESTMRELLRTVVRENLAEWAREGDELILIQSRIFQKAMFKYFEGIFKNTLAENVRLLHGILPEQVAIELKQNGFVAPVSFPDAAVLFTDFEAFSQLTAHEAPADVIRRLDTYFTEFDRISAVHGLEKIKTIGDSYMAVAGVPEPHVDPVRAVCDAALEMLDASNKLSESSGPDGWKIRIGVHVGPLVAGVIGKQKFSYDVWGATVNFASRMESSGEPGRVNVSTEVFNRAEPYYLWQPRGAQPVKRLGSAEMFFLLAKKA